MRRFFIKNVVLALICCLIAPSMIFASSIREVKYRYESSSSNYTAEKLSHPNSNIKEADGIIDFENGDPDTGQNYSWTSVGYGKYMYVGTCYAAMYNTMRQMAYEYNMDLEEFKAMVNVLYNETLYVGDEKNNPDAKNRAVIIKLNTETLEVSIIQPPSSIGGYRASIEFKDKLYFSATGSTPYLLEIDPKTDETKVVYKSQKPSNPSISTGIRGLTVVGDELIASMIGDNGAYIVSSPNPSKGESSFKKICTQEDLLDYPAYLYTDSIFGGSIWDMVCFNDKLYFTVVTGKNGDKSAFAMFSGEKNKNGEWNFNPIIGKDEDNTKYPIGLGASRSGAANLQVFDNHLYIGGYNDPMVALSDVLNFKFENLYKDLSEPVNLWRMDKNEDIELVAGEPIELFSSVVGNQSSGFGSNLNQYVWDMETYQGKLYVGTFNIGSLAYPIMQLTNGDILDMTDEEIEIQIKHIKELMEILQQKNEILSIEEQIANDEVIEEDVVKEDIVEDESIKEETNEDVVIEEKANEGIINEDNTEITSYEETIEEKEDVNNNENNVLIQENKEIIDSLNSLNENLEVISDNLDSNYEKSLKNKSVSNQEIVLKNLEQAKEIYEEYKDKLSKETIENLENLLNEDNIQNFKYFIESCKYLSEGERGFSLLVSEDGKNFEKITSNGFSDPYNHGLRTFSKTTTGLCIGTANPFNGTQIWRIVDNSVGKTKNSTVDKTEVIYDKYKKEEVKFEVGYNRNTLDSVQQNYKNLTEGKEFTLEDGNIVFNKEYLDALDLGTYSFRFRFSNNSFIDVEIKVIDSTSGNLEDTDDSGNIGNLNNSGSIQTGDDFIIEIFIAVSILCIIGLFAVNKKRKIKN